MQRETPPLLILINPWIYDFAAYDLWSKPLGLLYLAGLLRSRGFRIHLIDCLDAHHPFMVGNVSGKPPKRRAFGTGKYWRESIRKPPAIETIPRPYSRYGLATEAFEKALQMTQPAAILVTSLMTYWYPGVQEAIRRAKSIHPTVPVILGGIYAKLCYSHALKTSGADHVLTGRDHGTLLKTLALYGIPTPNDLPDNPYPAFDLLGQIDYICLETSTGCPYRCAYCASPFLAPVLSHKDPHAVLQEIVYWHEDFGVFDFAFYDDALLVASQEHFGVLLEGIARLERPLRFHTPNAVHVNEITKEIARLMHRTGFRTLRFGLESSDFSLHRKLGGKVREGEFEQAVQKLVSAGFHPHEIGAYILAGLPGQSVSSVSQTIEYVAKAGAVPFLSEYSPIPHTPLWDDAVRHSRYDIRTEPLFHNNTLWPCWEEDQQKEIPRLKKRILEIRDHYR
jgi:hypothetical protein